jgi:hypothetical protein
LPQPDGLEDSLAEARRLLAEEAEARMRACAAEIEQVLAKYGCRLDVTQPQISIVPN